MAKGRILKTDRHGAVFGLAGWSGSGKTTLVEQVVSHLVGLGYDVATVKHAHHHFDADIPGKDSFRHRQAGARQVLVSSAQRSALFSEHASSDEPDLPQLLQQLAQQILCLLKGLKNILLKKLKFFGHLWESRGFILKMIWSWRWQVMKRWMIVHCRCLTCLISRQLLILLLFRPN